MELKKIPLPFKINKPVLALGAQAKNTLCFAEGRQAYLSAVHLELSRPQDYSRFEQDARYFLKKNPKLIVYDLHPEYQSAKFTGQLLTFGFKFLTVQHHHAHIVSCMAENGLKNQKIIGVAFDGTGLGTDNTIWGAEFLVCDYRSFTRAAHLREIPLLGAQAAIREPWRLSAIWLYLAYKDRFLDLEIPFSKKIDQKSWGALKKIREAKFNSPLASSMGRLFDAAASLILAQKTVNFEAELAIELERLAMRSALCAAPYHFIIGRENGEYILDPRPMFKEIVGDIKAGRSREETAYKFHLTVAQMVRKTCLILRKGNKINSVVLSGGVFHNNLLLGLASDLLYKEGFSVFRHKNLPPGDASISLGQAVIANFRS